ncbi:MAG: siphovirus ReqiPepy6 Gp37-like family protein [Peptostreptococcaceae bacterium]|nr:siphovirus ReqiPepy6 Gp37-like family protein [Peptostreptococcaceae bacterium]
MDIKVFNTKLDLIGIIDTFSSFRYKQKFYDIGEFELHIPFNIGDLEILQKDNIIYVNEQNSFIVDTRQIKLNQDGSEYIQVNGKSLLNILNRRIIYNQIVEKNNANEVVKRIVNENVIAPKNIKRKIENIAIGELADTLNIDYQNRYGNVLDEIIGISKTTDVSFYILLDHINKKLLLKSFSGTDRTINQNIISPCVFSRDYENVEEQEYVDSLNNYKNVTLVAGSGEGINRKVFEVGEHEGLNRYELYTDARDLSDKEQKTRIVTNEDGSEYEENYEVDIPIETYNKILEQRGKEKLRECTEVETFESKISLLSNLEYGKDFRLGDTVTVINKKWNLVLDTKITEIEEVWESTKSLSITFGNNIPTLLDKIKMKVRG